MQFTMGTGSGGSSHLPNMSVRSLDTSISSSVSTPVKPAPPLPSAGGEQQTVKFKSLPVYLMGLSDVSPSPLETALHRWVHVGVDKLDLINLSTLAGADDVRTPIFIDAPLIDDFLPGDQLVAIDDFTMLGTTLLFRTHTFVSYCDDRASQASRSRT